jgi:hypothetical protein
VVPGSTNLASLSRVVALEYLEQLRPPVGFERLPRVVGKTKRIARPSCTADLDHHLSNQGTTGDLPQPTARVVRARVPSEVGADLPAHKARLLIDSPLAMTPVDPVAAGKPIPPDPLGYFLLPGATRGTMVAQQAQQLLTGRLTKFASRRSLTVGSVSPA